MSAQVQAPPPPSGVLGREGGGGDAQRAAPMEGVDATAHAQRRNLLYIGGRGGCWTVG